jgi:hypothetical protein
MRPTHGEISTAPASVLAIAWARFSSNVMLHFTPSCWRICAARIPSHVDASLMSTLGPDASLFVGIDDQAGPRDRCCDVEGELGVHLSRHVARHKPQQLSSNRDCEPVGSRGSDACSVAALSSSPRQCLVDNIPVLGSVDSFQDDRGIRRAVYRLETCPPCQDRPCRLPLSSSRVVGPALTPRLFPFDVGVSPSRAAGGRNRFLIAGSRSSMPCA